MTAGRLIAITGPAAVGKSTLARRLQAEFERKGELWLVMELDVFARALSRAWIGWGSHQRRHAELGFTYSGDEADGIGLAIGVDGRRVLRAFHRSVAAVVNSGIDVICETIIFDGEDWDDWTQSLGGISACWVKLNAPLAILEGREKAERPSVSQGLARGMTARTPVGVFNIEADTRHEDATTIVQRILNGWTASQ